VNELQRVNFLELSDSQTSRRALQGEFWALAIATALFNVGSSIFFLLYNLFMLDLGVREQSLGILAGAMALGSMAGTIPIGMLAKRVGIKKVLIVCLLLVAGAFCARVFLLQYSMQVAFAFLDGVMLCGWVVCLAPAVANAVE
jgi:predicted MFS family arabinose efflux permease